MYSKELKEQAATVLDLCHRQGVKLTVAESCTGGLLAGLLTEIPDCSPVFEFGFVTYSNEAKSELLGVDAGLIETHGAVSEQVARAMAQGALKRAYGGIAAAITGIAGPGGGTAKKPVGLVYIAVATAKGAMAEKCNFGEKKSRTEIRLDSVAKALEMLEAALKTSSASAA